MTRTIVTGGSSALGVALVSKLSSIDSELVMVAGRNISENSCFHFDAEDKFDAKKLIQTSKPDTLYHLIGTTSSDWDKAHAVNVDAAEAILRAVEVYAKDCKVVLIGSAAEYGRPENPKIGLRENDKLAPNTVYGLTKAKQTLSSSFFAANGVNVKVARVFNLYGPKMKEHLLIGSVQKQIHDISLGLRESVDTGPLNAFRDYIHVDRAVELICGINELGKPGEVYNVGSGRPIKVSDIVLTAFRENGVDWDKLKINNDQYTSLSNQYVSCVYADMSKTNKLLKQAHDD